MSRPTDIRPVSADLYFLPIATRMPLKFGPETLTQVTCARVRLVVADAKGNSAAGWAETPLSVQWGWPSSLSYEERLEAMQSFCIELAKAWSDTNEAYDHPLEIGHEFLDEILLDLLESFNEHHRADREPMPWLAALISASAFDLALHDAYGRLVGLPTFETFTPEYMTLDLSEYLLPVVGSGVGFEGKHPVDYFNSPQPKTLPAWHLIGGMDPLEASDLTGKEPDDGYPVLLRDWIQRDGLKCLKIKLRGNDPAWDYERLVRVGKIAVEEEIDWLSTDFNCTVTEPAYVNEILDRLMREEPRTFGMILYVEQPFPYDLELNRFDVHSVSARKPLFMDESAHDWTLVRLGRDLGWTGVALKTCKTLTGAILSLCWAKAHGMTLMVQDLSNPMLAQIPHVLLASYAGTIMGVETNSMQFYPAASAPEAEVHPGLYQRRGGQVDLSTLQGPGFGYRLKEMRRELPEPAFSTNSGESS